MAFLNEKQKKNGNKKVEKKMNEYETKNGSTIEFKWNSIRKRFEWPNICNG